MNRHRVAQDLREELRQRQAQHASLQLLWSHLQPEEAPEDSRETREKIRVTGSKLKRLLKQVEGEPGALQQRLVGGETAGCSVPCAEMVKAGTVPHQDRTPSSEQRSRAGASPEVPELRKVSSERSELMEILSDWPVSAGFS